MRTFHRFIATTTAFTVLFAGAYLVGTTVAPDAAQAQTAGAAAVVLNTPTVTAGGAVSANGTITTGLKRCASGGGGGGVSGGDGPLCNCCNIPPRDTPEAQWSTCLLSGASYSITDGAGAVVKSGSATLGSASRSPSGCTTACTNVESGVPSCQDATPFSLSTTGLTPGSYTLTVTSTDCRGQNSASQSIIVNPQYTLTVNKAGTGGGRVTSSPSGIDCPAGCGSQTSSFNSGQGVTLSATANASNNSVFAGWSGGGCSGTGSCAVTMNANKTVTSTFNIVDTPEPVRIDIHSNRNTTFSFNGASSGSGSLTASTTRTFEQMPPGDYTLTPAPISGYSYRWLSPSGATANAAARQSVPSGSTKLFDVEYYPEGGLPRCGVSPASVPVNTNTTATVESGTGVAPFSWSGGGSPSTGSGSSFTTSYGTTGTKTIRITDSAGQQGECQVVVGDVLFCSSAQANIAYGGNASFTAQNGTGPYSWSAPTGSPNSGAGQTFNTSFGTNSGQQTVTVTSGGQSAQCSVNVGASVPRTLYANLYIKNPANGWWNLESITVNYNQTVGLMWSSNGSFCSGPSGPGGDYTNSSYNIGNRTTGTKDPTNPHQFNWTYALGCGGFGQTIGDYATVYVRPECLPAGQTTTSGQAVTVTGRGGDVTYSYPNQYPNYTWSAPGGSPSAGTGGSFTTTFTATGTKTITLSTGGMTANCTVTVNPAAPCTGTVIVNSNVGTTWTLTGPQNQNQTATSTSVTYPNMPSGNYVLSASNLPGYGTPTITPASAQALNCGATLVFNINYPQLPPAVDLSANPTTVITGNTTALSWTTTGIATGTCTASANPANTGWSGAKNDNGNQNSGPITAQTIFTLTCRRQDNGQNIADSVTVSVRSPQCSDASDNDGDTFNNYPTDPGCSGPNDDDESNAWPQCNDNVDNTDSEDTLVDENDPGCWTDPNDPATYDSTDNDETNTTTITGCNDGLDNDGDGTIDAADDGCLDPTDPSELKEPDIREI